MFACLIRIDDSFNSLKSLIFFGKRLVKTRADQFHNLVQTNGKRNITTKSVKDIKGKYLFYNTYRIKKAV